MKEENGIGKYNNNIVEDNETDMESENGMAIESCLRNSKYST